MNIPAYSILPTNSVLTNFQKKDEKLSKKNAAAITAAGIGVTTMTIAISGLITKGNFSKNIAKKGLEFRNNLLVNKHTGEKFTGKIKSNIGTIGFDKIETQIYESGVLTEKNYKNALGKELYGTFYKDGKEFMNVQIGYPYFVPYNKSVATYMYNKEKTITLHADRRGFSGKSVFEWARNYVKENGWLK